MKCFIVFSMKRSGHHAVIRWISQQISGDISLFNNCEIIDEKIIPDVIKIYKSGKEIKDNQYHYKSSNLLIDAKKYDALFFTFEDKYYIDYTNQLKATCLNTKKIYQAIIVRDFYNNSASRHKTNFEYTPETLKIWIDHVNNCFNNPLITGINFNRWFKDKNYRKRLTEKLDIPFTDAGLNDVHGYGSSTFDNKKYNGNAQKMDILNRWKNFRHDARYLSKISNKIKLICKKYFDMEITNL